MPNSPAASQPPHRPFDIAAWLPSRRALLWAIGAFVLGLVLFLLVWRGGDNDFYRAGPAAPTAASPQYAPLPAPIAGSGSEDVSDVPASEPHAGDEQPRLVETAPPAPPPVAPTAPAPRPAAPVATSQPQPVSTPAPKYPSQSLRRGEQGTVMVSAEIGADGVPTSVDVARSSGSRYLDRAAVDAVRRWRFRPAMADGRPTSGRVQVPISFQN
ncbi:energy transducer TonB [Lysobacter solisilvae (ex Woo and Kim 2020)]|uniref:Energy transducer TonB n=1 Tax=Agrilutibacter terrestris TaxID=2865112 RepID=A0A7H0FX52_9GAMM|nr:energy transducer TonB [Lysobacter terrestris]QNP40618.1 energy transducer TonB [Lysobacter terrestris]